MMTDRALVNLNVAGVASLVWSANPYLSAIQVHEILATTAFDIGPAGYDIGSGFGFVNADAAVRRAIAIAATSGYAVEEQTSFLTDLVGSKDSLSQEEAGIAATLLAIAPEVTEVDWSAIATGLTHRVTTSTQQNSASGNDFLEHADIALVTESTVGLVENTLELSLAQRSTAEVTREHAQALEDFVAQLSLSDILSTEFEFAV